MVLRPTLKKEYVREEGSEGRNISLGHHALLSRERGGLESEEARDLDFFHLGRLAYDSLSRWAQHALSSTLKARRGHFFW